MGVTQTQIAAVEQNHHFLVVRITARRGWLALELLELWAYPELLYFFIWRDIKVRYKRTVIRRPGQFFSPYSR
jgi:lipopolysaccharide transport system permease protein